jgi:triacylglycerol esterase/lipase EstA (alpha/beta hydrolase family)
MSFRKYGGVSFSAKNNVVNSRYNNSTNLGVSKSVGQQNSHITFNSDISGNIQTTGTVASTSYYTAADYRLLEHVSPLNDDFTVDNLYPISFNFINSNLSDIGFIAHEVQAQYPFMVIGEKNGDHYQSINYNAFIGILVKEVKDLKQQVNDLTQEVGMLKSL